VPVLFDKKTQRIVNNESADIMRIFATGFKVPGVPLHAGTDLFSTYSSQSVLLCMSCNSAWSLRQSKCQRK